LEKSQKIVLNNLLQSIQNDDNFGYSYDDYMTITTEIATDIANIKKDLKIALTENQLKKVKNYFLKISSKQTLDLSLLDSSIDAYLGLSKLSTDTETVIQAFVAIKMKRSEALRIRDVLFMTETQIKNIDFLISSLKSDYDSALKAGADTKVVKDKLVKAENEKSKILNDMKTSLIDILTRERYEKFIRTYNRMLYLKRIENIIFNDNFIGTLKNIEKSA
jgi:hypothetical protein